MALEGRSRVDEVNLVLDVEVGAPVRNLDGALECAERDDGAVVLVVELEALADGSLGGDVVVRSEGDG